DGGWQHLVDGLADAARDQGVQEHVDKAMQVVRDGSLWRVPCRRGRSLSARSVVLAVGGPADASRMVGDESVALKRWAEAAVPVIATCRSYLLDGPGPRRVGAYGLDRPVYTVDQSRTAHLAPAGTHLVHGLVYEPDLLDADAPGMIDAQMSAWYPGWRDVLIDVVDRRRLVVAHDRPRSNG